MYGTLKNILKIQQVLRLPRNSEFKVNSRLERKIPEIATANIKRVPTKSEDNPNTIKNCYFAPTTSEKSYPSDFKNNIVSENAINYAPTISQNKTNNIPFTKNPFTKYHPDNKNSQSNFTIYYTCKIKYFLYIFFNFIFFSNLIYIF